MQIWSRITNTARALPDVRNDPLDGASAPERSMSVWCLPIELHPQAVKCKICGREVEQQLSRSGRFEQICRSCLVHVPEKPAA